tara:strand:+ start:150 stop:860 length:711 start_codon:yes stop_codon:yes gene_type:complete
VGTSGKCKGDTVLGLSKLEDKLQYRFNDQAFLERAITHRSAAAKNNERLEFLGDSILGAIVADHFYLALPSASEGELSRMRSQVVRKESLAKVARQMNLSPHLILGSGEIKAGSRNRDSILADSLEALIGAIYLDGGFIKAHHFVVHWFNENMESAIRRRSTKDAKTALQEWLQGRGKSLPHYQLVKTIGEAHSRKFTVSCVIEPLDREFHATSDSLRKAEQLVAQEMLEAIKARQ